MGLCFTIAGQTITSACDGEHSGRHFSRFLRSGLPATATEID
jgi:hypothetical protein